MCLDYSDYSYNTSPCTKDSSLVPVDDEPTKKGKRVKRPAKKSITTPAACIFISEALMETQYKRKEKVDVTPGKGIELTHPSGSGMIAETPPSVEKTKSSVTSEGTSDKPREPDVTKDDSTKSESDKKGLDSEQDSDGSKSNSESNRQEDEEEVKDDDEKEDEFAHTLPNTDDEEDANLESKNDDKIKGDEDRGMDDTTNQFNDDVDARLNEPTQTDEEVVQDKEDDVEMTDAQQEKENLEITQEQVVKDAHVMISTVAKETKEKENLKITQEQVVEDAHVTITTVAKETKVPDASVSHLSDLASKFLNFLDIHPNDAKKISPLDFHVHHEIIEQVKNQLPHILPGEVSNFAPLMTEKMITGSLNQVNLAKVSSQLQSSYEVAATLTEFELKKILIDKMKSSESYLTAPEHQECYDGLIKSYNLDKD
nr:hypothetical protein [Tanacetum cinerariifolium]